MPKCAIIRTSRKLDLVCSLVEKSGLSYYFLPSWSRLSFSLILRRVFFLWHYNGQLETFGLTLFTGGDISSVFLQRCFGGSGAGGCFGIFAIPKVSNLCSRLFTSSRISALLRETHSIRSCNFLHSFSFVSRSDRNDSMISLYRNLTPWSIACKFSISFCVSRILDFDKRRRPSCKYVKKQSNNEKVRYGKD